MEFEHNKFGKCVLSEITQKQLETFMNAVNKNEAVGIQSIGDYVREAVKVGMIVEPAWKSEDVDNANPGLVKWISSCVADMIKEVMNIDPLS